MGTSWSARIVSPPEGLAARIAALLGEIVAEMSHWEPESAISRFNRAGAGSWHALPSGFFTVLEAALGLAAESEGAFDPTLGALVDLWGFGPAAFAGLPDAAAVAARPVGRWRAIQLDRAARRALQPGGAVLDFSGIAKGYAVDRVADLVRGQGCRHFLFEIGGELRGEGVKPDGQPWWVDLEGPADAGALPPLRVALHQLCVATSGDYRRFFEQDGRRFAHSLDPRTGAPVADAAAAVTVLHASCMMADALATVLTALGPAEGMAFAEAKGLAARIVTRRHGGLVESLSPALIAML
jgi:thiamine biosynthesis lipoprotein